MAGEYHRKFDIVHTARQPPPPVSASRKQNWLWDRPLHRVHEYIENLEEAIRLAKTDTERERLENDHTDAVKQLKEHPVAKQEAEERRQQAIQDAEGKKQRAQDRKDRQAKKDYDFAMSFEDKTEDAPEHGYLQKPAHEYKGPMRTVPQAPAHESREASPEDDQPAPAASSAAPTVYTQEMYNHYYTTFKQQHGRSPTHDARFQLPPGAKAKAPQSPLGRKPRKKQETPLTELFFPKRR